MEQPNTNSQQKNQQTVLLITAIVVGLVVLVTLGWFGYAQYQEKNKTKNAIEGLTELRDIGAPVDEDVTIGEVEQLLDPTGKSRFLTFSSLKNTYSGGLLNIRGGDLTSLDDNDVALTLELNKGSYDDTELFTLTKAELQNAKIYIFEAPTGAITIPYTELEVGYGVSITRTKDLINPEKIDDILIEAIRN